MRRQKRSECIMKLRKIRYALGDMTAQYLVDDESGQVSLALLPLDMEDK